MTYGGSSGYDMTTSNWDQITFVDGLDRETKKKDVTVINEEHKQGMVLVVSRGKFQTKKGTKVRETGGGKLQEVLVMSCW